MVGTIKWEPSNTQKGTSPLAHYVRNSLPHKSHRFCSPMRNNGASNWKPANGNHFSSPSCSLRSQFTASLRSPMQRTYRASKWEPLNGNHFSSPSCSLRSQFTASLRSPMLQWCHIAILWFPLFGFHHHCLTTGQPPPLAHCVRNSLPHSLRSLPNANQVETINCFSWACVRTLIP